MALAPCLAHLSTWPGYSTILLPFSVRFPLVIFHVSQGPAAVFPTMQLAPQTEVPAFEARPLECHEPLELFFWIVWPRDSLTSVIVWLLVDISTKRQAGSPMEIEYY